MTIEFYEGPAGTGKTHNLITSLEAFLATNTLRPGQRVLALTFMHGSRRRLEERLTSLPPLVNKFDCMTFDSLASYLVTRWKDLLAGLTQAQMPYVAEEEDNEYEITCVRAANLFAQTTVQQWVAATYPIIVIDEAQDLSVGRLGMVKGMTTASHLFVAADGYQHLENGRARNEPVEWFTQVSTVHPLTLPRRTNDAGLLAIAAAIRAGNAIVPLINFRNGRGRLNGFSLIEVPSAPLMAWNAGVTLFNSRGSTAILTLSNDENVAQQALTRLMTQRQTLNRQQGTTFGPFTDLVIEQKDAAFVAECFAALGQLDNDVLDIEEAKVRCENIGDIGIKTFLKNWLKGKSRILGWRACSQDALKEAISTAVFNRKKFRVGAEMARRVMTIHQAKNREFENVIILWTFAIQGAATDDYRRRLLYNAVTRAKRNCTVIVMGQNRLRSAPFA